MRKMFFLLATFCLIAVFQPIYSQSAEEIVESYLETIGGQEQLNTVESVKIVAKGKAQGMELPITMYQKAPGLMRMDMVFQGKEITQMAFNGEEGWSTNFMTMEAEKWDAEQSSIMKSEMDFINPFLNYEEKGYTIALEGKEEIEGTACFKVKLTKKPVVIDGKEEENLSYYYFDEESMVPIMLEEYTKSGPMKGKAAQTYFSDYQEVDGIYFPFNMAQKVDNQTVYDMAIEQLELNVEMDKSMFDYPEPAPADSNE